MKYRLFTLLFAVVVASMGTMRAIGMDDTNITGTCGTNLTWSLDTVVGVLTITGSGTMDNWNYAGTPWFQYQSYIKEIYIRDGVTSIGNYAFQYCSSLTSVSIPSTIETIGSAAFNACYSLTSVTIPYGVTSIGESAFGVCHKLSSVTIPNSVRIIGANAFDGCALTSVSIPNSVDSIGDWAFYLCPNLTTVEISSGVIGEGAFKQCEKLESLSLGNNVTSIGEGAFSFCTNLTSVEIPNSVKTIGNYAFYRCSALNSVTLGCSVTSIGTVAFGYCNNIISVVWNAKNCVNSGYFGNQVESFFFGNEVEYIPPYCCSGMNRLTSITIPACVIGIGDEAFAGCTSLGIIYNNAVNPQTINSNVFMEIDKTVCHLVVPIESIASYQTADVWKEFFIQWCIAGYGMCGDGLGWIVSCDSSVLTITGIGDMTADWELNEAPWYPFKDSIEYIFLPKGITSIGNYAFSGCSKVKEITCKALTPPTCGTKVFSDIDKTIPLHIPDASIDLYKIADQWEEFFHDELIESGLITVRLNPQSCSTWSVVRLWAWTANGNLFDAWPGIIINQDEDGWYSYTFDESLESVNIIWTDGTNQTIDINGVTESTCYSLNSTTGKYITVTIEQCPVSNPTDIETINGDAKCPTNKILHDGQLYILRGDKIYTITGQEVK